jgi:polysaccharide export outer membrane protein
MMKRTIFGLSISGILLVSMVGCGLQSTPGAEGRNAIFVRAKEHGRAADNYVIDPPDEIQITSRNVKELEHVQQALRPDGKLSLALLGEVQVAGMTSGQLTAKLNCLAEKYYGNPDIQVNVEPKSKFFTVFGRGVNQTKKIPYTGNDNVVKALAEAGINEHAWPEQVWLVRPAKNVGEQPSRAVINFKQMQQTGDTHQNYALQEGDILTVPASVIDTINFKMVQILGPINGAQTVGGSIH